jgi:hypothetical protein
MTPASDGGQPLCISSHELEWRTFPEAAGVAYQLLRRHPAGGGSTLLLRFAPGADYPAPRHPAGEEYFVLDGSLDRPSSREGCTVLVVLPARVEPVGDVG